jgi:transcription initiation factor TFIIF subunit beta
MPQNELLDLIFDCFKRYNYWSLKSLKSELNQPEAYLKSTLEKVAVLVKSGRFAMTWTLKPEVKVNGYAEVKNEQAPDSGIDGPSDVVGDGEDDVVITIDDDEEDNEVMEDVLPA